MAKELLVSDESLNSQGLRIKTDGIDLSRFNSNPVMLFNHIRVDAESVNQILPIGNWVNLRIEGNKLFATPVFQIEGDKFAAKIARKFKAGVIRGASIGIVPVEVAEIDGEVWVTKSLLMEISVVDIPSNQNAVIFYNQNDEPIELKAVINMAVNQTIKKVETMSKFLFVPAMLGLSADASDEAVRAKMIELSKQNAEIVTLKAENKTLKDAVKSVKDAAVITLVDTAITDKKIEATQRDQYIKLATADLESVKSILDGMGAKADIKLSDIPKTKVPGTNGDGGDATKHNGKSFLDLQKTDSQALVALKVADYAKFCLMYKEQYGKDYKV